MIENRKRIFPWMLIGGGFLLVLAWLVGVFLNHPPEAAATPTPASVGQVQRVSLQDAKKAFDAGTAVFLDVRDSSSYATSHIPGALLISITDLDASMGELNPKSWIIPYCT
jgi:hypothetical protein